MEPDGTNVTAPLNEFKRTVSSTCRNNGIGGWVKGASEGEETSPFGKTLALEVMGT